MNRTAEIWRVVRVATRVGISALAALVGSAFVLLTITALSFGVAIAVGKDVRVPALVDITVGTGSDLASGTFRPGVVLWYLAIAVTLAAFDNLVRRSRPRNKRVSRAGHR